MTAVRRRTIVDRVVRALRRLAAPRCPGRWTCSRSGLRYAPVHRDEAAALARRIEELAGEHPRYGYRRIWALLRREGWSVNKKAVHRAWKQAGLKLAGPRASPQAPPAPRPGHERLPPAAVARQRRRLDLGFHLRSDQRRSELEMAQSCRRVHTGMPGAGGATGHDGRGDPGDPGRGRGRGVAARRIGSAATTARSSRPRRSGS